MSGYPFLTRVDRAQRAERVARRYAEGASAPAVASEFGISPNYVYKITQRYGVSRPKGRPRKGEQA